MAHLNDDCDMNIKIILKVDTFLFGTKSLLSVRPYNIHHFNNNIRQNPYTKTEAIFWLFHGFKITSKTLRHKNKYLSPADFRGFFFF